MQVDILVAGGGCVGALAAALAARSGWRVALASPQPALPGFDHASPPNARAIALAPQIETRLLNEDIPAEPWYSRGQPVLSMHVSVPGSGEILFGQSESSRLARIVEVPALQFALEQAAERDGVRRINEAVTTIRPNGVELESGVRIDASLVLACDGADSRLRQLAGFGVSRREYGQMAIVARLQFAEPHAAQARQTMRPDGVLGVLPLSDGSVSVVWSLPEAAAAFWLGESEEAFADGLNQALGVPWGQAILLGKRQSFPLQNLHADRLAAEQLCLLGDAAHTVHPLAGLGLNLGLADALTLVDALRSGVQQKRSLADPAILAQWSRRRQAEVAPYRHFVDALAGLGRDHTVAWRGVGLGFSVVNRLSTIRSFFETRARRGSLPA